MIQVRKSNDRGQGNFGWLKARYSFSFANYYDPNHMGFGPLRVINQDTISEGGGFPTHGHRNMEIITYIIRGELLHQDNTGNIVSLLPNKIQRMTAGRGIRHSEFNGGDEDLELLQIWIEPQKFELPAGYEEKEFSKAEARNRWQLLVSPSQQEGSLKIHQQTKLFRSFLDEGNSLDYQLNGKAWLQIIDGRIRVNDVIMEPGDGAGIEEISKINISAATDSHLLLFDLN